MALAQLVYVSRREQALDLGALQQLALSSSVRNAQRRITGVLLSRGDHLMQLLEGDMADVVELYETIRADARHAEVRCVMCRNVKRRMFPDSAMRLAELDGAPPADGGPAALAADSDRERIASLVRDVASRTDIWHRCAEARALLDDFRAQLVSARSLAQAA